MKEQNTNQDNFEQLYSDLKQYVKLQTELVKVEFVEKLTILLSAFIIVSLVIALAFGGLFYLFFSLAYTLESVVGSLELAFAIIAGLYLLLILILVVFRKSLVVNPIVRFLSNLFLNKN
jgi:Putative Actinobacterial Holin-X, holin superfamily III